MKPKPTTPQLTSDEREERLTKPYKEHLRETLKTTDDYRGYLSACHDEGPETFALAVQDVLEFTTTTMRDKCVEKVKARLSDPSLKFADDGIRAAITDWTNYLVRELESLQVEREKQ